MILDEKIIELAVASVAFVGTHMVMSALPVRTPLVARFGVWPFRAIYSAVSFVCFTWMVIAFMQAPHVEVFETKTGLKHLSYSAMAIACFLLVCGYTQPNPTAVGMEKVGLRAGARGVLKITRHPVMWGVAIWSACHLLASGHMAALVFFGAITFLAIAGSIHIDKNKKNLGDPSWDDYMEATSNVPMLAIIKGKTRVERGEYKWWQILLSAALYFGLLISHESIIGVYVMPF